MRYLICFENPINNTTIQGVDVIREEGSLVYFLDKNENCIMIVDIRKFAYAKKIPELEDLK